MKLNHIAVAAIVALAFAAFCATRAEADVVTCATPTTPACPAPINKPKASVVGSDYVLYCDGVVQKGDAQSKCAATSWHDWAGMASWSWTLTTEGWYRVIDIPTTTSPPVTPPPVVPPPTPAPPPIPLSVFTPTKYACTPKLSLSEFRWDYQIHSLTDADGVANWYCDLPDRVVLHRFCGNPLLLPKAMLKGAVAALGLAAQSNQSRACNANERAMSLRLHDEEGIKITVAPIAAGTRPIFAATATNRKGADTGKNAKVGDPCEFDTATWSFKRLKNTDGTASMYFAVPGGYTLCKITGVMSK